MSRGSCAELHIQRWMPLNLRPVGFTSGFWITAKRITHIDLSDLQGTLQSLQLYVL